MATTGRINPQSIDERQSQGQTSACMRTCVRLCLLVHSDVCVEECMTVLGRGMHLFVCLFMCMCPLRACMSADGSRRMALRPRSGSKRSMNFSLGSACKHHATTFRGRVHVNSPPPIPYPLPSPPYLPPPHPTIPHLPTSNSKKFPKILPVWKNFGELGFNLRKKKKGNKRERKEKKGKKRERK